MHCERCGRSIDLKRISGRRPKYCVLCRTALQQPYADKAREKKRQQQDKGDK